MMGVVVNGPWPMSIVSSSSQSFSIQNEISGGSNLEKSFVTHSSSSSPSSGSSSVSGGPWLRKMKIVKRIKRKIGLGSRGGESSPNNLPSLVFHAVHGENIELSCEGRIARRVNSFCNGITFSNRVVKVNERVSIKLLEISQDWRGVLRFGFTNVDPVSMSCIPAYSIPNLTSKPGYWAKTFDESDTRFTGLSFKKDSILFYYVTAAGNVHFGINGDEKGVFFHGVDTRKPLWALIDVYGCTTALEFVDTRTRLNNSRKNLQDFGGSYSGSIGSSGKQDGNELELKILSSMSSMNLRSDEQYGQQPHRHQHVHCHQRSVSCCQHFSGPPHARQYSQQQFANDDDEDLFQKPPREKEVQSAQKHIDFTSCTTTTATASNNNNKKLEQFEEDSKNLARKEAKLYAESQLEIVCRRASLSPASFKLFNNKPSMSAKAAQVSGSPDLNNDKSNNHNNVNNNNVFIAKGSNNNQAAAKNYNNTNNQNNCAVVAKSIANNNVYIEGPLTPAHTPLGNIPAAEPHTHSHVHCARQRHQSLYQYNNSSNNVVTVTKIEPKSKLTSTNSSPLLPACKAQAQRNHRYSYHCATGATTPDEEYLEQQLLLAASSPVSPASSASSSAYVVMREVHADVEPIYTEVSGGSGSMIYSNNSTGSTYSYCSGSGQSPVIPRNNSQITPIYSTTFKSGGSRGSSSSSLRKPQTPPPPPPTQGKTLPVDISPKQSSAQKKAAAASKHQWSVGCVSCYERPVNSIFHACGHMCMCYQCAFEYWTNKEGATCPICSTIIADVVIRTPPAKA